MQKGNKKLSTQPYKGVRDFYPEDMFIQNYLMGIMQETVERFGYVEYASSILEPAELYEGKSSEEIVSEQTYTFTDRGERRVTLRPEMTPSVARLVAARKRDLAFPLRWYSIPNVFRYERPQRGRLREHWQLNCDIFGVPGPEADAEIIMLASAIMHAFGAENGEFEIRISSRKLLSQKLDSYGLSLEQKKQVYRLLDKKDKIDDFNEQLSLITDQKLDLTLKEDNEIKHISALLKEQGVTNVRFNPELVRGFDYYTGIVFEVFDTAPENSRSLFGGGRYDNLLNIFGVDDVPAVGFGMGDVTTRDFLESHGLLPEYVSSVDLYIATIGPEHIPHAQKLAAALRGSGLFVAVNFLDKKIGEQIKIAGKQSIPFVLILGEDEIQKKTYTLKNLATGEESAVKENEIAELVLSEGTEE